MEQNGTNGTDNDNDNDNDNEYDNDINKKRVKRKKVFSPPTLEEIASYISEKNLNVDAKRFMDYYEASDWTDKNGDKVKNWKLKAQTWASHSPPKDSGEIFKPITLADYMVSGEDY